MAFDNFLYDRLKADRYGGWSEALGDDLLRDMCRRMQEEGVVYLQTVEDVKLVETERYEKLEAIEVEHDKCLQPEPARPELVLRP